MNGVDFRDSYGSYEEPAKEIAKELVIRSYVDGNSRDTRRATTKVEADIIYKIAVGAMTEYGWEGYDSDATRVCNMAEFILMQFIPECNTYDTIYIPLMKAFKEW